MGEPTIPIREEFRYSIVTDLPAPPRPFPVQRTPAEEKASEEALLKEYSETCCNLRHFGNARLTNRVIFGAMTAGLLGLQFGRDARLTADLGFSVCIAAVVLTAASLMIDWDLTWQHRWLSMRAREIEQKLHLRQYSIREEVRAQKPVHRYIKETYATYIFFATVFALWIAVAAVV